MSKASNLFLFLSLSLAAICCISSCVTTDLSLGASYIPTDRDISIKVKEFDITLGQRYPDSLQAAMSGTAIVGSINTVENGTVTVGTAMTISPATDSLRWGGSPVFKSMVLSVPVSARQVVDDSQKYIPQNIYLHKLRIELDSTRVSFNSIKDTDYDPETCMQGSVLYTDGDSLVINLTEEFAKPLFDLDTMVLDSTELFLKAFKGVYLRSDAVTQPGGRLNAFDVTNGSIAFTFNSENSEGHRRDTTVYFYVGYEASVLKIDQDRVYPELEDCGEKAVYNGLAGIKPFIDARKLRNQIAEMAKQQGVEAKAILVSKAQFNFPFEYSGKSSDYDKWPSNMYLCRRLRDSTGIIYYSPISEIYASNYDLGDINRSLFQYSPDAALYVQSLLNSPEDEIDDTFDLWVIPTVSYTSSTTSSSSYYNPYAYYSYYYYGYDPYSTTSSTTYYYVDNVNYLNCVINGTKADRHPVLRMTFTLLK